MDCMAKKVIERLTEQLRRAIDESGQSRYAICKATGIDQSQMSRFMHGSGGLSVDALDALGEFLDLQITLGPKARSKKGK